MATIKINDLFNTLEDTRSILLQASNDDGMVSRADLQNAIQQAEEPLQRRFLAFFYGFLRKLENRPRMRVTEEVIDRGITFIQEQIIPTFEINETFSMATKQEIAQIHETAFPMAMELIRITQSNSLFTPLEVAEHIAQLTEGLYFDDYGSEAAIPIEAVHIEHQNPTLTPDSFIQALEIPPNDPLSKVERFEPADRTFLTFIEQHFRDGLSNRAQTIVELMQTHLKNPQVIILGADNNPALGSEHPVYVVGIGHNHHLAGFKSVVIWT